MFTFALATLVIASESTMAAFALPLIGADLDVSVGATAWILLAYALPLAALAIPLGRWIDSADLRTVFIWSLSGVGLVSVLTAVAPSFGLIIVLRAVQGVAAAAYLAGYLPIVTKTVRGDQRARAMSYIATIMTLGSMAVTPLGGLVADTLGWRAVFVIKLPLLVAVLVLGRRTIPTTRAASGGAGMPGPSVGVVVDAVLIGGAITAGLLAANRADGSWLLVAALLATSTALIWCWLRLRTSRPVIALVRSRPFGLTALSLLLLSAFTGLTSFSLPYFVSDVMGESLALLGIATLFFAGVAAAVSPFAGHLADRLGPRPVAATGAAIIGAGLLSMLTLSPEATVTDLAWRLAVVGLGAALCNAPTTTALLNTTPPGQAGIAGGVGNVARTIGTALGPAIAAAMWSISSTDTAGFRSGVVALAAVTLAACVTILAGSAKTPA
ncbi:MFS transporter [Phytoactinopolyspora halotolerans]|uniref:MFS transporter n=1 Tax=Phytoactinopolyspora halotolerans TaxID=1981512 RepID=A0A6L9SIB6_9ACTN|nr:MFS transporter [Phytoactinopolyspora halotolerans]NEE04172.1 MFS transporter [Phytoactinopolyspora halotolerans]